MLPLRRKLPRRRGKKRNKQKKKRTQIFLRPLCFFGGPVFGEEPAGNRESTLKSGGGVLFLRKAQEQIHHAAVAFHAVRLLIEL